MRLPVLYMLDTNVVSAALKGNPALDRRLRTLPAARWCVSAITRAELRYGIARRPGATRLAQVVEAFLSMARTEAWTDSAADLHGRLRARLASKGSSIGDFDEMIAAHALSLDATLVSDNTRHFSRIRDLRIENWIR